MARAVAKPKIGRPTLYRPDMCAIVYEIGKDGGSNIEMIHKLDIAATTFYEWVRTNAEFRAAVERAELASQVWWENKGRERTFDSKDFNALSYIFQMKNRFPQDWRDRQHLEHTGPNGGPLQSLNATITLDVKDFAPEQREQLRSLLLAAKARGQEER